MYSPALLRALGWAAAVLLGASGLGLIAVTFAFGHLARVPHAPLHPVEVAGLALGSIWLLCGLACGVLAATGTAEQRWTRGATLARAG